MRKRLCIFMIFLNLCLLIPPINIMAEERGQQESVIEPTGLQTPPEPQPDPEIEEKIGENDGIQQFSLETSQEEIFTTVEERVKEALLAGETQVNVLDLQIPSEENLYNVLYYSPYFSNGIDASFYYSPGGCYTRILIRNTMSPGETADYFAEVDKKVDEIIGLITDDMSDEEKALVIHDYLVYEGEYDYDNLNAGTLPQDSYRSGGLLMKGKGVCQAYAYAYKYLMERLGIECYVTSSQEINHAWNIVNIDGSYYHVDCTWDDPVYDRLGMAGHGYFLVSDEAVQEIRGGTKQHKGWDLTEIVCDNTKYDNAYWENVKSQIILSGDSAYYIEGSSIYRRQNDTGKVEELKNLGRWYVWGSSNSYWTSSYSGLFMYENELYYNTSSEIRKIDLNGENDMLVYQPDTSEGYIYGSKKSGTEIQYILKKNPSETGEKSSIPLVEEEQMTVFEDVSEEQWFYESVNYVYEKGIMSGLTESMFGPSDKITRSQFAAILYRIEGNPDITYRELFSDVPDNTWFTDGILWAADSGIVSGYENSSLFGVNDDITREQMAVMMYRYAQYKNYDTPADGDLDQFGDSEQVSGYAEEALSWAIGAEIISGKEGGILDPQGNAIRGECAAIIMRFMEMQE